MIHDTALTTSGFIQDDVDSYATRMYRTIANNLKVNSMELEPEIEIPEDEEEEEAKSSSDSTSGGDEF